MVFVLERCLYERGVCIRELSVLESCLYWKGVCIREVSVLERCHITLLDQCPQVVGQLLVV